MNRNDESLDSFDDALEAKAAYLGPDSMEVAATQYERARLLHRLGRHEDATAALVDVERIYEIVFGPASSQVARMKAELGELVGK